MTIKKGLGAVALGTLLFTGSVVTPTVFQEKTVEAASLPQQVNAQEVTQTWVKGDYVSSSGIVHPDGMSSLQLTTQNSQKGTVVLEVRRNQFCEGCWDNYRITKTAFPVNLYKEPYYVDGRSERAEKVTTSIPKIDFINSDSKENYVARISAYISKPNSDKNSYLGMIGITDPESFYITAKFYPNVDLTGLTHAERDNYFKGVDTTPTPTTDITWTGRVLIKSKDMVLYNPQGKVHRKLTQYEGLRVYDVQSDRYQVGGGYYVLKGSKEDTLYYYGHVFSKDRYMYVYSPDGKLYKKFLPMQTARVYSMENGRYQVGGGYYVIPASHVQLDR